MLRTILYPAIAIVQGFSLGAAQADGQWFIFALVICSVLLMFAYLAGDAIRDIQEWRADPEKVKSYLIAIGMSHLIPMFVQEKKE